MVRCEFIFSVPILAIIAGCATLSEHDCRLGNWNVIGYQDGALGAPFSRIHEHKKACAKYRILPDLEEYRKGRDAGLLTYCTPENGLQEGLAGSTYAKVCPRDLEIAFLKNYRRGHRVHTIKETLSDLDSKLSDLDEALERADLSPQKRETLRRKRGRLTNERQHQHMLLIAIEVVELTGLSH